VYTVLNGIIGLIVFLSAGYFEPREYDLKEYWTWKGSGRPPWFVRALRRRRNRQGPEAGIRSQNNSADDPAESIGTNAGSSRKDEPAAVSEGCIPMTSPPNGSKWAR
jgi:AGZA family xanthine/uracil permease-like MFS transporter